MTREPRGHENRGDNGECTRRAFLKTAGGVASALAGAGALGTAGAQTDRVNVVSEGADKDGNEPVDDILGAAVESNTEIFFPPGTYRLGGFSADGLENVSIVGQKATLVPPEGSTDHILSLSGRDVRVEGFTFDYTAEQTAPKFSMRCADGLELKNCEFVGVADVLGGSGNSAHDYHFLPAITSADGEGLVQNVSMADGVKNPSNRGGIWFGAKNKGTLAFDGLHMEKFANNSLYAKDSDGPVIVKNSFFRNNNVGGPRIGSNGSKVLDTTVVSDGEVPVQEFTGARTSRGIWIQDACDDVLIEGCDFTMSGPYASSGIVYEVPNTNADVRDCRFRMDVDSPAIECGVDGGPITIEDVSVTGDAASESAISVNGRATVSNVCVGGSGQGNCDSARSMPPQAAGEPGKGRGNEGGKSRGRNDGNT